MKHILSILVALSIITTGALAADPYKVIKAEKVTLTGSIIDNLCANAHKKSLDKFIASHTKECALMPKCAASGYSLYHYGALLEFDRESNKKVEEFLKKKGSKLEVEVVIKKTGGKYSLISIKNK